MFFFLNLVGTQGIEIRCRISTVRYITHGKGMSARNKIHTSPLGLNVNDNPHAKDSYISHLLRHSDTENIAGSVSLHSVITSDARKKNRLLPFTTVLPHIEN
jgi:hypothetical protein